MSGRIQRRSRRMPSCAALGAGVAASLVSGGAFADADDPGSRGHNYADVWLRLDADRAAAQAWVGGTASWPGLDLGANLVLTQYYPGVWDPLQNAAVNTRFDHDYRAPAVRAELGPSLLFGGLFLQPKLGLGYDFGLETLGLVPQVTAILEAAFVYIELWAQIHLYSPFESGLQDSVHGRLTALFTRNSWLGYGGHIELTSALSNFQGSALRSFQLGPAATASVLPQLTLGAFAGYDFAREARNRFPVGRLTATYLFF